MNPHEELEKYIREKREAWVEKVGPCTTSFTRDCGFFGGSLTPAASANNVWRWCKKGRVPNKRYHSSILEKTGIDFGQAVRQPKPVTGTFVHAVSSVDFQDLLWVYAETPCVGCFIDGGSDECENAVRALTGLKCKSRNFVLKRKPTWEVCTKQNTKVGDVVRSRTNGGLNEVRFLLNCSISDKLMVVKNLVTGYDSTQSLKFYEVET